MFNVTKKKKQHKIEKRKNTHTHTHTHTHTDMYIAKKIKKTHTDIVYEIFSKKYPHSMIV